MTLVYLAEGVVAITSFVSSLLIIISFAKSTTEMKRRREREQNADQQKQSSPSAEDTHGERMKYNSCKWFMKAFFERDYLPLFSTGVFFIAVSIVIRSLANVFALIQDRLDVNDGVLCNFEAMLRTYAIISNFMSLLLLSVQLYFEILGETDTLLYLFEIKFLQTLKTMFFVDGVRYESTKKFRLILYDYIFIYPLIIAMLPWMGNAYGANSNGLQHCTYVHNRNGRIWGSCTLFLPMLLAWILMMVIFLITSARGRTTFTPQQNSLCCIMFGFTLASIVVWLPLLVASVSNITTISKFWEVMIQLDGTLYAMLYFYLLRVTNVTRAVDAPRSTIGLNNDSNLQLSSTRYSIHSLETSNPITKNNNRETFSIRRDSEDFA